MTTTEANQTINNVALVRCYIIWQCGKKVVFDADLAKLYGVATKGLIQAIRRHLTRFPDHAMPQRLLPMNFVP